MEELTAVAERVSAGSGEVGRRRGVAGDIGGPRKKKASMRCLEASGVAGVDEEVEDGSAELTGLSEGRGGGSGDDYGERRRGSRSAITG